MDSDMITLNDDNFKTWRRQVLRRMQTKRLELFIKQSNFGGMPPKFETPQDELVGKISNEYKNWENRDQLVYRWILSSLSQNLRMELEPDSHHAFQLWNKIECHFSLQELKEYEDLVKTVQNLRKEKSILVGRIKDMSEECLKISEENDALEKELIEEYGAESIADLLPMNPAR